MTANFPLFDVCYSTQEVPMDANKLMKPDKLLPGPPKTKATSQVKDFEHDYGMEVSKQNKRECDGSAPTTPMKAQGEKSLKPSEEGSAAQVSNNAIPQAIMSLEKRIDTQLEDIKEQTSVEVTCWPSVIYLFMFHLSSIRLFGRKGRTQLSVRDINHS
ncbi:hypothetical protein ILYODFUR_038275 [Ilyodon furcidens]|uniref:Uncharacterized protein n=1 Tax=Ilyodon furcidens TaxID=33524 RepID=A0ABV0T5D2_9TELE